MYLQSSIIGLFLFFNTSVKANDTTTICTGKLDKNGNKAGYWICKKNGLMIKKERYKSNQLISYMRFDKDGKIIETMNKKGKIKKYSSCGCY